MMPSQENQGGSSNRGFAGMDEEQQREIASKGGKTAHEKGTAHEFSHEEAVEAGRKGGKASHGGGRSESSSGDSEGNTGRGFAGMDKEKQREIASKGGKH
jgi:general stress protein YciG